MRTSKLAHLLRAAFVVALFVAVVVAQSVSSAAPVAQMATATARISSPTATAFQLATATSRPPTRSPTVQATPTPPARVTTTPTRTPPNCVFLPQLEAAEDE